MQDSNNNTGLRRQRLKLLAIFFLFALPLLVAVIWNANTDRWRPGNSTNYGELISPARPLAAFDMQDLGGTHITQDFLRGKWTLVYIGPAQCGKECQGNLYTMRQVRVALNEKIDRVQRLWVLSDATQAKQLPVLLSDHPGLAVAKPSTAELEHFLVQFSTSETTGPVLGRIYLVDPLGNLMMRYPPVADPKGLLKDLQRLLLTSWVG